MKRYRFTSFAIDSNRSLLKRKAVSKEIQDIHEQILAELKIRYGDNNFDEKLERYLELETDNIRIVPEYHHILHETEDAYVCGYYYPSLTSSCCLGEKIFNNLILTLREYYKNCETYKKVYNKDQIQNWKLGIEVLLDWGLIDENLADSYKKLYKVRIEAIHLGTVKDFRAEAKFALQQVYKITDTLFSLEKRKDIFFWVPGEPYIRKDREEVPIVKEFFIPNCKLLGYKHPPPELKTSPKGIGVKFTDPYDYDEREITDEEFRRLRIEWNEQQDKAGKE